MNWLPESLPKINPIIWKKKLNHIGLAGLAASKKYVIVGDRDASNTQDTFHCFSAATGKKLWEHIYPAHGKLDYGNSPRATPLIYEEEVVYLLGAFGDLSCLDLETGAVYWQINLIQKFGAKLLTWGYCSSPLIVNNHLIINPGAEHSSLVALDPLTGEVQWKSAGSPAGYSSFITGTWNGQKQIIGYDHKSIGGWDIETGKRLWKLLPPQKGDFNVPTPIQYQNSLVVSTENNGTRLYEFSNSGIIKDKPSASNEFLTPDTSSPVVIGDRVFGCWEDLFCLDLKNGLKEIWAGEDKSYFQYASLIGSKNGKLLIMTTKGELILIDAKSSDYNVLSRIKLFPKGEDIHSHPAIVGNRLYARGKNSIICIEM